MKLFTIGDRFAYETTCNRVVQGSDFGEAIALERHTSECCALVTKSTQEMPIPI